MGVIAPFVPNPCGHQESFRLGTLCAEPDLHLLSRICTVAATVRMLAHTWGLKRTAPAPFATIICDIATYAATGIVSGDAWRQPPGLALRSFSQLSARRRSLSAS